MSRLIGTSMDFNFTYFVQTLPWEFGNWTAGDRLYYFQDYLQGFTGLTEDVQDQTAEQADPSVLEYILELVLGVLRDNPETALANGWNVTNLALAYFTDPSQFSEPVPEEPSKCDKEEDRQTDFLIYFIPPAMFTLLLLSFLKKRQHLCRTCCSNRPAIIYPINFIDERSRRWAFLAVFAMLSYRLLALFTGEYFWKPDKFDDSKWMETWGWTKVFVGMINVVMMGMVYYPLLACISLRRFLVANIIGLLCTGAWMYNHINIWIVCRMDKDNMSEAAFFNAIFEAPMLGIIAVVVVAFILDLCINIHTLCTRKQPVSVDDLTMPILRDRHNHEHHTIAETYVRALFKRTPLPPPTSLGESLIRKIKYNVVAGYKYSPQMVCTMVVALMAMYKMVVVFGVIVESLANWGQDLLEDNEDSLTDENSSSTYDLVHDAVVVVRYSFMFSNVTSAVLHIFIMIHIVICHRSNILKLYRGDRSWHFKSESSPAATMVASMRYSGYQIAFLLYGYALLLLILFVVAVAVSFLIVLPLKNGTNSFLFDILKTMWPTILIGLAVYFIQMIFAKFFFLQSNGQYMALNNRRAYHVSMFFLFFFNVILGVFSCLKRVLFSMVFGTLLISRLDKCLLMRGFERFDTGFRAYLGMCEVDLYHTHPVLVCFAQIMKQVAADAAQYRGTLHEEKAAEIRVTQRTRQRIRNKWWKCITMANNPTIIIDMLYREVKNKKMFAKGAGTQAVDQLGNVAAAVVASGAITALDDVTRATDFDVTIF